MPDVTLHRARETWREAIMHERDATPRTGDPESLASKRTPPVNDC
jgi:hypothetical protein